MGPRDFTDWTDYELLDAKSNEIAAVRGVRYDEGTGSPR